MSNNLKEMKALNDIIGNVRNDNGYYSLKMFITPYEPLVKRIADVINKTTNPMTTAQDFVHSFIHYGTETGEMWRFPHETLSKAEEEPVDCDDMAILLCSLLRTFMSPEEVFVVIGTIPQGGHAWIEANSRIIEATAGSDYTPVIEDYKSQIMFNDKHTFAKNDKTDFDFLNINGHHLKMQP
jgi:hypothetical protein